jgi:hypothetical protein
MNDQWADAIRKIEEAPYIPQQIHLFQHQKDRIEELLGHPLPDGLTITTTNGTLSPDQ